MLFLPKPKLSEFDLIIERLKPQHDPLLKAFRCDKEDETDFIRNDALLQQTIKLNETYLLFERGKEKVISYITFSVGSFVLSPEREVYGVRIRDKPCEFPNRVPCMLIGRLATDKGEEGRGGASYLLAFAVREAVRKSELVPFPFLAVHAYPDKVAFYERNGFERAFTPDAGETPRTACMYVGLFDVAKKH